MLLEYTQTLGELKDLITPAAVLLEQRGDADEGGTREPTRSSGSANPGGLVHPADVLHLAQGSDEGERRVTTASSAARLLFEAAGEFRRLMPTLADEQVPLAMQLLHAAEATQQALFGGVLATDEETQTQAEESRPSLPMADRPASPPQEEDEQLVAVGAAGGQEQQGRWIGLVGATKSQAQEQLTGSLEDVIQQVAAQTQLDQNDDSHVPGDGPHQQGGEDEVGADTSQPESLATTIPGGGNGLREDTQQGGASSSERESEVSSQPSHRRRRMHSGL